MADQQRHVLGVLAQRRHVDREDGEAVEQVFAEAPRAIAASRSRWVAAMMRTSTAIWRVPPTRSNTRSCSTRSSLTCIVGRHVADLVEEERAAVGLLEAALAGARGAGERALLVAEQLALEQVAPGWRRS